MAVAQSFHDFETLDRPSSDSGIGLDAVYESWSGKLIATLVALDIDGEIVRMSGFGAFVSVPFTYGSLVGGDVDDASFGNLDASGVWTGPLGADAAFVAHAGLALPTASDSPAGGLFGPVAAYGRYGDLVRRYPNITWGRVGASLMGADGRFFMRFDLGVDIAVYKDGDVIASNDLSPVLHLGLGAGADLGRLDVTAEGVVDVLRWPENQTADSVGGTIAVGARLHSKTVAPGIAIVVPVALSDSSDFDVAISATLTGHVR